MKVTQEYENIKEFVQKKGAESVHMYDRNYSQNIH
jgi:hypothetical protein